MLITIYTMLSVLAVSAISLIGILSLPVSKKKLNKFLLYFVSFAAGALFGDAFIHLLPEAAEAGFTLTLSLATLGGIVIFFVIEQVIHWHHCHLPHHHMPHREGTRHPKSFAYMNLIGDGVHNFVDGLIIAAS